MLMSMPKTAPTATLSAVDGDVPIAKRSSFSGLGLGSFGMMGEKKSAAGEPEWLRGR
jgi:hypothetical protein